MADKTPVDLSELTKVTDDYEAAARLRQEKAVKALSSGATIRAVAAAARVSINTLLKWRAENK